MVSQSKLRSERSDTDPQPGRPDGSEYALAGRIMARTVTSRESARLPVIFSYSTNMSHIPNEIPVRATLVVVECLSESHYRATLPNGKEVVAHLERRAPAAWRHLPVGSHLLGELSPYDFNHARIAAVNWVAEPENLK